MDHNNTNQWSEMMSTVGFLSVSFSTLSWTLLKCCIAALTQKEEGNKSCGHFILRWSQNQYASVILLVRWAHVYVTFFFHLWSLWILSLFCDFSKNLTFSIGSDLFLSHTSCFSLSVCFLLCWRSLDENVGGTTDFPTEKWFPPGQVAAICSTDPWSFKSSPFQWH